MVTRLKNFSNNPRFFTPPIGLSPFSYKTNWISCKKKSRIIHHSWRVDFVPEAIKKLMTPSKELSKPSALLNRLPYSGKCVLWFEKLSKRINNLKTIK